MNKFFTYFFLVITALTVSCSKDDEALVPVRDLTEQYAKDLDSIDKYLDTHFIVVDANFNVTIDSLREGDGNISIRTQTQYPLQFKMVNFTNESTNTNIDYKLYYLKLSEGEGQSPSAVDSVYTSYSGNLINARQFDSAINPVWFKLDEVIPGWSEIFPLFKTGTYNDSGSVNDPVSFSGYGAGVMFVPSGLGYFNRSVTGIPSYSPLIFSFKLYALRYRDHDGDGILSKDEVAQPGDDPREYDTDGDGAFNMFDIDDDNDRFMTKNEINKNPDGTIIFEDDNNNGIPNYLDPLSTPEN